MQQENMTNVKSERDIKMMDRQLLMKEEQEFFDENYDSDGSIGQYLNFEENELGIVKRQNTQENKEHYNPEKVRKGCQEIQQTRVKKQRSIYHNFQKHLVTTIRRIVPARQITKSGDLGQASLMIWDLFVREKFCSKQFLYVIFGVVKNENESNNRAMEKYKLKEIFQKYGQHTYKAAQKYLREKVIQIFNQIDDERILYQRRIQKKNQFIRYVRQFIFELEEGVCLGKKLLKSQKQQNSQQSSQEGEIFQKRECSDA